MVTSKNLLNPSNWEPVVAPSQDMILGCYYVTTLNPDWIGAWTIYSSIVDVSHAYDAWRLDIRSNIKVRVNWKIIDTNYWRLLFNQIVPEKMWFVNEVLKKWVIKRLLSRCFEELGQEETAVLADRIKDFGYKNATLSGLSISKDDMIIPDNKQKLLDEASEKVKYIQKKHWNWFLTDQEKYTQSITIWAEVKKVIEIEMKANFNFKNHIFNFIDSWARWNWWNLTQLCWMKWLVASTTGKTIELPIKSTLKEWFSTLEYFIATHGWRKGKSDTALKTAQSGYLTRRLVDASQNMIIKEDDCHTIYYKSVSRFDKKWSFDASFDERIYSHTIASDIKDTKWNVLIKTWTVIDTPTLKIINDNNVNELNIRSVLTCETEGWVCKKCYWLDLWANAVAEIWTPVWIIAAQSIWEPGTQLTMRTFHSGWVAKEGWDMTQWLSRVEELFEARNPKVVAEISDTDWIADVKFNDNWSIVSITAKELQEEEYYFWDDFEMVVKEWQEVKQKQLLARSTKSKQKITSLYNWLVKKAVNWMIIIKDKDKRVFEYKFEIWRNVLIENWDKVKIGQKLVDWYANIARIMNVAWVMSAEQYIVDEIKSIYSSQWQTVNSKHIELIVRQMFSRVRIIDKWDTEFYPGDIVDIIKFKKANDSLIAEWKRPSIWERLLLGITKISLYTDSWLSAASFQETVRVLVEGSVSWRIDKLQELKENVIIGRLIPAWKQYRKLKWVEIEADLEDAYFSSDDDGIDLSIEHIKAVESEMVGESDF
jgi:DNA-directed RNA polymerase subunit beta'